MASSKPVAGQTKRTGRHNAAERDDGHFRGAAADIEPWNRRLGHGQIGAHSGGHGLLDEVSLAGAGLDGGLEHGAFSTEVRRTGCTRRCGAWAAKGYCARRLVDEGRDHGLRSLVVGDDAVFEQVLGGERVRRVVDHVLGLMADGQHALSGLSMATTEGSLTTMPLPGNSNKGY